MEQRRSATQTCTYRIYSFFLYCTYPYSFFLSCTYPQQAAFDEAEEKRVETHQLALKYVLASGDTGCVWIDRFLYLLAEHISKTNAAMEAKLKSTFAQYAQVC